MRTMPANIINLVPEDYQSLFGLDHPNTGRLIEQISAAQPGPEDAPTLGPFTLADTVLTFLYAVIRNESMAEVAAFFRTTPAVASARVQDVLWWMEHLFAMSRQWTTADMKQMIDDFARKKISKDDDKEKNLPQQTYCPGVLSLTSFHYLQGYGDRRWGWNVDSSQILFVQDAHNRFKVVEAFPGSRTQLDCFLSSWYYQIVGDRPKNPRPAANQIPVLRCRLKGCPKPAPFTATTLCDGQLDLECDMLLNPAMEEPNVMFPVPKIYDDRQMITSDRALSLNMKMERMLQPIRDNITSFFERFKTMADPSKTFPDLALATYNRLLEACGAIWNYGIIVPPPPVLNHTTVQYTVLSNCRNGPIVHMSSCNLRTPGRAIDELLDSNMPGVVWMDDVFFSETPAMLEVKRFIHQGIPVDPMPIPRPISTVGPFPLGARFRQENNALRELLHRSTQRLLYLTRKGDALRKELAEATRRRDALLDNLN